MSKISKTPGKILRGGSSGWSSMLVPSLIRANHPSFLIIFRWVCTQIMMGSMLPLEAHYSLKETQKIDRDNIYYLRMVLLDHLMSKIEGWTNIREIYHIVKEYNQSRSKCNRGSSVGIIIDYNIIIFIIINIFN